MEALTKNKEEIEKINEGCGGGFGGKRTDHGLFYYSCNGKKGLCPTCKKIREERIKTSILWCEDEIEFLEERKKEYGNNDRFMFSKFGERLEQLQSHLNWLKEQEKRL